MKIILVCLFLVPCSGLAADPSTNEAQTQLQASEQAIERYGLLRGSWMGARGTVASIGWGIAAIYVGQQDWSQIPQGSSDRVEGLGSRVETASRLSILDPRPSTLGPRLGR